MNKDFWRNQYGVDDPAEVPTKMLMHNFRCMRNILNNPEKFPKADWASVEEHEDEIFFELTGRGIIMTDEKKTADRVDGYDRDDLGESPDY